MTKIDFINYNLKWFDKLFNSSAWLDNSSLVAELSWAVAEFVWTTTLTCSSASNVCDNDIACSLDASEISLTNDTDFPTLSTTSFNTILVSLAMLVPFSTAFIVPSIKIAVFLAASDASLKKIFCRLAFNRWSINTNPLCMQRFFLYFIDNVGVLLVWKTFL